MPVTNKSERQPTVYGKVQHDGIRRDLCLDGRALCCYNHDIIIESLVPLDLLLCQRDKMFPAHSGNKKRAVEDIQRYQPAFIQQGPVIGQVQEFPVLVANNG